jgi:hypothetical protein
MKELSTEIAKQNDKLAKEINQFAHRSPSAI